MQTFIKISCWRINLVCVVWMFSFCLANNQRVLLHDLFKNYQPEVIPRCQGHPFPVDVKIGLALRQIIELNEPKQILTLNTWMRLYWTDCQLVWNASEYGGIDNLVLPHNKIWTPDITLYDNNQNGEGGMAGSTDYRPAIGSDGSVAFLFPTVMVSLCLVDSKYFPFDVQTCPLHFGSWMYQGLDLNVVNRSSSGDMSAFKMNTEWDLRSIDVKRTVTYYSCCPESYPAVIFYVKLKRKPTGYVLNLFLPCILITILSLFGFLLPIDSGEKVALEITVLLALAFFSLVVSDALPPSESVPYVGIYFASSVLMVSLSTMFTVIVLSVHYRGQTGHRVPNWVRRFILGGLASILFMKKEQTKVDPLSNVFENNIVVQHTYFIKSTIPADENSTSKLPLSCINPIIDILIKQLEILKRFERRFKNEETEKKLNCEWKRVAMVMDRLLFVFFLCFVLTCTLVVFLQIAW